MWHWYCDMDINDDNFTYLTIWLILIPSSLSIALMASTQKGVRIMEKQVLYRFYFYGYAYWD